jgi:hypothetical protein
MWQHFWLVLVVAGIIFMSLLFADDPGGAGL